MKHTTIITIQSAFILLAIFIAIGCEQTQGTAQQQVIGTIKQHYMDGIKYGTEGNLEAARTSFQKAMQLDSINLPTRVNIGILDDVASGRIEKQTAVHLFRGIDYQNKGLLDAKISELTQAIAINDDYVLSYNERGIAYFDNGQYDLAVADRDMCIKLNPDYFEAYFNKGLACEKAGRYDEAIVAYQNFIDRAPESYHMHRSYAEIHIASIRNMQKEAAGNSSEQQ